MSNTEIVIIRAYLYWSVLCSYFDEDSPIELAYARLKLRESETKARLILERVDVLDFFIELQLMPERSGE